MTYYYELNGERKGPVGSEKIVTLIQHRILSVHNLIWKEGYEDWILLGRSEFAQYFDQSAPPPIAGSHINNTLVWFLAFAPFIGLFLEYFLIFLIYGDGYQAEEAIEDGRFWFMTLILNIILGIFDEKNLQKAGVDTSRFRIWTFLVPVYLYQRAEIVGHKNMPYFIVWCFTFGLYLLAFI